jgi:hypothetical protein
MDDNAGLSDGINVSVGPPPSPPELTRLDYSTIALALETQERLAIERTGDPTAPAAIAARRSLVKVRALLKASSS